MLFNGIINIRQHTISKSFLITTNGFKLILICKINPKTIKLAKNADNKKAVRI